ncbi:magnesium-translocating P-type ATPase [Thermoanaerobacter ethanolicus JW 200]|uniref:magnesium-translocating P-type ATPase n=1 Tax=Thermoanaerobacter ethanolicus TaxID=1757 RepID=UPI000202D803|nr:magnesium-translocating P-type ATPase [Thermoanaerobacter ethanolicus JW 200]
MKDLRQGFWSIPAEDVLKNLETSKDGLSNTEAKKRIVTYGYNSIKPKKDNNALDIFISQFKSPIILILFFAVGLSFFLHDTVDAIIILTIILVSGLLSFWQEYNANNAVQKLLEIVQIKATVLRDGKSAEIPVEEIVPGDIVMLKAGAVVPGDSLILESNSLSIDEAILTGETFPTDKEVGVLPFETSLSQRRNCLWMGTHVVSGTAKAVIISTGKTTEFGRISERLKIRPLETEFERGVKHFGYFLMEVTLILTMTIFAINVFLKRPVLDSFLFSLAIAVGLTPQLLPAIISINLAHGAKMMARVKVIVKRLASIENFGSMDVLCSDKTGTLTEGIVKLQSTFDVIGNQSDKVLFYAYLNAYFESGFINPIDEAIRTFKEFDTRDYIKLDERPYDFVRKRLSIILSKSNKSTNEAQSYIMITKGALDNIIKVCKNAEIEDGKVVDIKTIQDFIQKQYREYSDKGYRTLGVAYKNIIGTETMVKDETESDMTFLGFITFFDPLKPNIAKTIEDLKELGISLKIITGDNKLIASNIVQQLGIKGMKVLTGSEIHDISDEALIEKVREVAVFAEIEPNEKERIIIALKKAGYVVGYMGDGINDASALHAADVSISVDSAVDVAKRAADIVLLEKDLNVLIEGVKAGRITFANTLKYVFMATSANFGNMFSMAGASLFLPFLPLLPKQILLTNLLTDFPEMTIATDSVDEDMIMVPRRWDIGFIRRFMIVFGLISSIFDYLTFGVLMFIVHASDVQFRTSWFIESVISASLIVLVIRTRKPFFKSIPGKYLVIATSCVCIATLIIPYSPIAGILGFQAIPFWVLLLIATVIMVYVLMAEIIKKLFYKKVKN